MSASERSQRPQQLGKMGDCLLACLSTGIAADKICEGLICQWGQLGAVPTQHWTGACTDPQ